MKLYKYLVLVVIPVAFWSFASAARGMEGRYRLHHFLPGNIYPKCIRTASEITLIRAGQAVTGTAKGECFEERLSGRATDDGKLSIVLLTLSSPVYPHKCVYEGALSKKEELLLGNLKIHESSDRGCPKEILLEDPTATAVRVGETSHEHHDERTVTGSPAR